ncbi:uncharacterized protein LACBIDRAFT_305824 [Laccaria bicolor S238N-H82]|uniref:Predicted protein n=1 Tax=Laccaria bicolor (strain S238N-H82 / ATCC MYA-4686) TaxID=486041 RepID=B0CS07_LACBS|nr:uncharacterized protein LACBIDRAFT_305824 [Laccaria bicolor S238N-H82]EDR14213.1 predicted protein [Laccaria bicolor S238N-H82]|eukprot:XP_001874772.1 predicted protein [Laccaria bicolor S238N-H82]
MNGQLKVLSTSLSSTFLLPTHMRKVEHSCKRNTSLCCETQHTIPISNYLILHPGLQSFTSNLF